MVRAARFFSIQHNRWFGVHNPFGKAYGKARDPFINPYTLARLSHSNDSAVRLEIINNLANRLKRGLSHYEKMCFSLIHRPVIFLALGKPTEISYNDKEFIENFIKTAIIDELHFIRTSNSRFVRQCVSQCMANTLDAGYFIDY